MLAENLQEVVSMFKLLSAGDVRARLRVSYQRVRELRLKGKLTAVNIGRRWLYDAESVERYEQMRERWQTRQKEKKATDGQTIGHSAR